MNILTMITIILSKCKSFYQDIDIRMTPNRSTVMKNLSIPSIRNVKREVHYQYVSNVCALHSVYESISTIAWTKSRNKFVQLALTQEVMRSGCRLGFDSFADTCCAGRHVRVESFVEGKSVTASGFANTMESIKDLPIANVLFAYDLPDGEVFILRVNNCIYLGEAMEDSLLCLNQCRENGIQIYTRPKVYCPNDKTAESICCPESGKTFPIQHHGPLPFLLVRHPTQNETMSCEYIDLTMDSEWEPYGSNSPTCSVISKISTKDIDMQGQIGDDLSFIGQVLMGRNLESLFSKNRIVHKIMNKEGEKEFHSIDAVSAKKKDRITPEELAKLWRIGFPHAHYKLPLINAFAQLAI